MWKLDWLTRELFWSVRHCLFPQGAQDLAGEIETHSQLLHKGEAEQLFVAFA